MHIHLCVQVPDIPADEDEENKVRTTVKLPLVYYWFKFNVLIQTDLQEKHKEQTDRLPEDLFGLKC